MKLIISFFKKFLTCLFKEMVKCKSQEKTTNVVGKDL